LLVLGIHFADKYHDYLHVLFSDPNFGLVNVPDERLAKLGIINKSVKIVPTAVVYLIILFAACTVMDQCHSLLPFSSDGIRRYRRNSEGGI
jgi:hypothetical protein